MNNKDKTLNDVFEKLADIEHQRWAGWQKYLHSKCTKDRGSLTIPAGYVFHLERLIKTSYDNLTEKEKESDRDEVRKYWPLIKSQYIKRSEQKQLREYLWLSHGHLGLYGDDGEMQCIKCSADYKRGDIDELISKAIKGREEVNLQKLIEENKSRSELPSAINQAIDDFHLGALGDEIKDAIHDLWGKK